MCPPQDKAVDIEEIHACHAACPRAVSLPGQGPAGPPETRLAVTGGHLTREQARRNCMVCPAATGAHAAPDVHDGGSAVEHVVEATEFPMVNPYGDQLDIGKLAVLMEKENAPAREYEEQVKQREAPPLTPFMAYRFLGEGEWPYADRPDTVGINPLLDTPEVAAWASPLLRRFVENVRARTTDMAAEPFVMNGYKAYADPGRFAAEVQAMFREGVLLAGLSCDLANPHDYRRLDVVGKSVLLTRDAEGRFRAFENVCRHRGMELVGPDAPRGNQKIFACPYHSWSFGSDGRLLSVPFEEGFDKCTEVDLERRNLLELPATERCGMLFIVPELVSGSSDVERMVQEVLGENLTSELESLQLGSHHRLAEQTVHVDANWKLGVDTFGESYHFMTVHPDLREALVPNTAVYRLFGKDLQNSCMTLGRVTTRLMAAGSVPESQWETPSALDHLVQVYHLMPNAVLLVTSDYMFLNQFWPQAPGAFKVAISMYGGKAPQTEDESMAAKFAFSQVLGVVATEDFPLLPRMQANFEQSRRAELVFGRNEACLGNQHRYYQRAIKSRL